MAAAVIVNLSDTTTTAINKKLNALREQVGAVTISPLTAFSSATASA